MMALPFRLGFKAFKALNLITLKRPCCDEMILIFQKIEYIIDQHKK
jgi:hypothetical protein